MELDEHGIFDGRSKAAIQKANGFPHKGKPGRPKGVKNKLTLLKEAVMENAENVILENLEEIVQQACKLAKRGDTRAMKLVMDRILPARKVIDDVGDKMKHGITINITGDVSVKKDIEGEVVDKEENT